MLTRGCHESLIAVMNPDGHVEHARQPAIGSSNLELWQALLEGRLTVVGRRVEQRLFVLFLANPPHRFSACALTPAEVDALTMICQGRSGKHVSFALGITESAVSLRLARATAKTGASSRTELIRIASLLVNDPGCRLSDPDLTAAESEILELIVRGLKNSQIATLRGRSVRTVANQVASLLQKSGAQSRRELVARVRPLRASA